MIQKRQQIADNCRLLAVDPSLTCSGWALFSLKEKKPIRVGILGSQSAKFTLAQRLSGIQSRVDLLFEELSLGSDDFLVCEGPAPLILNPHTALKVEQVRGIFETLARSRNVRVAGRVNPRTVHTELLGLKGKQLPRDIVKALARQVAERLFGRELKCLLEEGMAGSKNRDVPQDIVDAILVGTLAASRLKNGIETGMALELLFQPKLSSGRNNVRSRQAWTKSIETRMTKRPR